MYSTYTDDLGDKVIHVTGSNLYIPLDSNNGHYQKVLDAIIAEGADCFDGEIPEELQDAADTKKFRQQLLDYGIATERLAQYQVALGREEVIESISTDEKVWDEESEQMVDVFEDSIVVTAIDPVDATITHTVYSDDMGTNPTEETIENPLITKDNEERADAQAIVDATPSEVVDAYNAL